MSRVGPPLSERVYALLLRAYPATFRARFESEIVAAFRDRYREASERSGIRGVTALWMRTIPDVVGHGAMERVHEWRRRPLDVGAAWQTARRSLVRSPAVNAVIVLTLAMGIGANVALFSVLRGVLLRPLPYPDADRLVQVWETNPSVDGELHGPSPLNFSDWETAATGLESMAAWYLTSGTYRTEAWVEEIRSAQVTADFFRVLGVAPMLGRDFRPEEVIRYGPVMLSHRVWVRLFGADPSVVGRTIVSSGQSYEIVGVMPPGFSFPDESVETWVAWDLPNVYADRPETRSWRFLYGIGRLEDGVDVTAAEQALDGVARALAEAYPELDGGWDTALIPLQEGIVGDVRPTLWLAFGAVMFLLLIACANVANLLLARVPARAREVAIRTTLGASRGRIVRELVAENLLLALAAGLLGLCLGALLLETLIALDAGRIPRLDEVRIDGTVLAVALTVSAGTSLLFGLAPALQALRASTSAAIGAGARIAGGRGQRASEGFVASQVAVALVLLTGAGLFGRSLAELRRVDPGFDPDRVATFRVSLDPVDGTEEEIVTYYDGLLRRIAEVPGVRLVGAAQTLPLNPVGNDFRRPYRPSGSSLESADAPAVQMRIVTPGYVETMGMTLLSGSELPESARIGEPLVALVNETLAGRLWPDGGAVGSRLEIDFREGWMTYTVTGVVADVKHYGIREDAAPEVYLSHRQVPYLAMSLVARTTEDPRAMTEALRGAVRSHVPMQPAHGFVSLEELLSAAVAEERFLSVLLTAFASIALVLAATGIYGVIAYSVSQRRREIGVRMALGAKPARVLGSVLGRAAAVAGIGTAVGLLLVVVVSGTLEAQLFGVSAGDPATRAAVASGLLAIAILAAYVPARRAAAVPPADVLRAE